MGHIGMVGCPKKLQTSEEDEVTTHVCSAVDSETCQLVNISATESRDHLRKKVFRIFAAGCDPDPFAHQYLAVQPASGPEISPLSPDLRQYGAASMTSAAWEIWEWGPGDQAGIYHRDLKPANCLVNQAPHLLTIWDLKAW